MQYNTMFYSGWVYRQVCAEIRDHTYTGGLERINQQRLKYHYNGN